MEQPIPFSLLNDFTFCPASVYYHLVDSNADKLMTQDQAQINGTFAHSAIDNHRYSTRKAVLQGVPFYSEQYDVQGSIDLFDVERGLLTERKRTVHKVYEGFIFQLYAQYYGLTESGYQVKRLQLYSMTDNKTYPVSLPDDDPEMKAKFENTIDRIKNYTLDEFVQENSLKCRNCIYETLCPYSAIK